MASWESVTLGLVAAVAAACLLAAAGRALVHRWRMRRRMAAFLVPSLASEDATATAHAAAATQQLLALLGVPSGSMVLLAAGVVGALICVLMGWTPGLLLAIAVVVVAGIWAVRRVSRRDQLEQQLVAVLQLMASALESGYSVQQSLERVVRDSPEPIASQLAQVSRALELGTPLDAALQQLAAQVGGENFEFFATITTMQHRVGGDLPTLLVGLATRIRERLELRAEMQALTTQARYSSWVLTALPFAVVGLLLVTSPGYLAPLVSTAMGWNMLFFGAVILAVGLVSIRAISQVEV